MSEKLFRKDIEPCCAYCCHGSDIGGGDLVCIKKGIVRGDGACSKFAYNPFKRRPPEPKKLDLKDTIFDDDFVF